MKKRLTPVVGTLGLLVFVTAGVAFTSAGDDQDQCAA